MSEVYVRLADILKVLERRAVVATQENNLPVSDELISIMCYLIAASAFQVTEIGRHQEDEIEGNNTPFQDEVERCRKDFIDRYTAPHDN